MSVIFSENYLKKCDKYGNICNVRNKYKKYLLRAFCLFTIRLGSILSRKAYKLCINK